MDNWRQEEVDLIQPGFIEFSAHRLGLLGFITVSGSLDYRVTAYDGRLGAEFSWQGIDDDDDASGRGWVAIDPDDTLEGRIYFHLGDESGFRATRFEDPDD